jgi:hypothetical protein
MESNPNEYKAQLEQSNKAGLPIAQHDSKALSEAIELRALEAEANRQESDTQTDAKSQILKYTIVCIKFEDLLYVM